MALDYIYPMSLLLGYMGQSKCHLHYPMGNAVSPWSYISLSLGCVRRGHGTSIVLFSVSHGQPSLDHGPSYSSPMGVVLDHGPSYTSPMGVVLDHGPSYTSPMGVV
jgi:hypothetical protein